ncbi:hypothetical protein FHW69_003815 [Luteibacter sp. Sphag1AF]|nr:hypothetical protein [Luteibacter sp. Sphag1AF]
MKYFERAHDGRRLLNRVEYFFDFWPDLPTALERSQLPSLLLALFGGPYHLFKEKLNVKLAGAGGYAPHQDGPAWTMLKRESITVMIAVDDADEHNGALQVDANFSCGRNFLAHRQGQLLDQDSIAWATIPLRAGDVIAFSSFLPHRSFGNGSSRSRRAYFITYNAAADGNCRDAYFDFKRRAFPPEIERLGAEDIGQWRTRLSRDLL